jgi:OmcA/MtrC family decaheme c-type cytochrome
MNRGYALFCIMILGTILLAGCLKEDMGPPGSPGPPAPNEPTVPDGGPTATGETCRACHGTGKISAIAETHPGPGMDVTLSDIILTNPAGTPSVSFNAATDDGPVTDLVFDDIRFYIADLVPADTPTAGGGTWSSPYFERWAYESTSSGTPTGIFDTTDAVNGNYTYTFVTGFGSAAALAEAPDYSETHTQRLVFTVAGHYDADGYAVTNNAVGFLDFVTPTDGGAVTTSVSQRMFVTTGACTKCHGEPFQQAFHATTYPDTLACVICHSPLGPDGDRMQDDSAYLSVFIHKIHAAMDITRKSTGEPLFGEAVRGLGYNAVTYPRDIENCVVCHSNPNNLALGSGDNIDNWMNNPTAEVCGSCHVDVDFTTGENHEGGIRPNNTCAVCHPATGIGFGMSVTEAHEKTPPDEMNVPEYNVNLDITPPVNGSYYVAGEEPEVRVTLTDYATGNPVDSTIYTTGQDDPGVSGGGLSVAGLYVYGPRTEPVPVLATDTVTDPDFDNSTDTPTQAHSLFVGGNDTLVTTDSSSFGYQLLEIPDGMTAGTYMVRVRIGDYGRINDVDYHIESTAFTTIQIGTATVSPKVAGNACISCHGTETAPYHEIRHASVFDTDECLSCHDQSGNHAIPLANRLHALHSTNSAGDIYNIQGGSRDWSHVTFPQNIQSFLTGQLTDDGLPRCVGCHTSDADTYKTMPYMMPCVGCHANPEFSDIEHMRQNGGPF